MELKLMVLDVDGTLTDGGIYYDDQDNETKKFSVKDGAGIVLGRAAGLQFMICTGRECAAVARRARDLKIDYLYQNVARKWEFLEEFMILHGLEKSQVAYCGDDWNDLAAMALCGWVACPADAAPQVKAVADYVCPHAGGQGAVRDAILQILTREGLLDQALEKAFGVKKEEPPCINS